MHIDMVKEVVTKPWGSFTTFIKNTPCTVKLLTILKGEAFSLQHHSHRSEFWKVISGHPEVTVGEEVFDANPEDEFHIASGVNHRVSAVKDDVVILEIATGTFDEDDITRLEDKYGRN